ncbi:unnamed protein product [Merluccius merluccius]
MFTLYNEMNKRMQGAESNVIQCKDALDAFVRKLDYRVEKISNGELQHFLLLLKQSAGTVRASLRTEFTRHMTLLREEIKSSFADIDADTDPPLLEQSQTLNIMREQSSQMEIELVQLREQLDQQQPNSPSFQNTLTIFRREWEDILNTRLSPAVIADSWTTSTPLRARPSPPKPALHLLSLHIALPLGAHPISLNQLQPQPCCHPSTSGFNSTETAQAHRGRRAEIILLMDSNGKFLDEQTLFPRHRVEKIWCPNIQRALELLTVAELGSPSHIIIHTGTNDLTGESCRLTQENN